MGGVGGPSSQHIKDTVRRPVPLAPSLARRHVNSRSACGGRLMMLRRGADSGSLLRQGDLSDEIGTQLVRLGTPRQLLTTPDGFPPSQDEGVGGDGGVGDWGTGGWGCGGWGRGGG